MLKGSAFYLEKQKSFILENNTFQSVVNIKTKNLCLLTQSSVRVLVHSTNARTKSWHFKIKTNFFYVPGLRFSVLAVFELSCTKTFLYKSKTQQQLAAIFLFIDHLLLGNSKEKLLKVSQIQRSTFRNLNFYLASALQSRFSQQHFISDK